MLRPDGPHSLSKYLLGLLTSSCPVTSFSTLIQLFILMAHCGVCRHSDLFYLWKMKIKHQLITDHKLLPF